MAGTLSERDTSVTHACRGTKGNVAISRRRSCKLLTAILLALVSPCRARCSISTGLLGFQDTSMSARCAFTSQHSRTKRKWEDRSTLSIDTQTLRCAQEEQHVNHDVVWTKDEVSIDKPTLRCAQEEQDENQGIVWTKDEEEHDFPSRSICVVASCNGDSSAVSDHDMSFTSIAVDLASQLSVPICNDVGDDSCCYTHALVVVPYQLGTIESYAIAIQIRSHDAKKLRRRRPGKKSTSQPFFVDFCPPSTSRLGKRFEGQSGTDLLIKAVSPGKSGQSTEGAVVYDLTAGFGQDSLLMLQGGAARVHMVERDPVVSGLLSDGLRRLRLIAANDDTKDPQTQRAIDLSKRLTLEELGDAVEIAKKSLSSPSAPKPDVCYVDPMFPTRTKSAAVKKNMQILHGLLGSQADDTVLNEKASKEELELLEAAWSLARKRVVAKRPINANYLGGQDGLKPSYAIKGSVNRWDVYVK